MNVSYPKLALLSVLPFCVAFTTVFAQSPSPPPAAPASTATTQSVSGQALVQETARRLDSYATIESKIRVRTDLLGQPLVGSGRYAQLKSTTGLLLRMELAIQAGEQTTSIKHICNGHYLWEHWRIGESERVNKVDLRRVAETLKQNPVPLSMTSSNLASGGLPRLIRQLSANFAFDTTELRSGKVGLKDGPNIDVWSVTGVWRSESLAATAPNAVVDNKIVLEKLPSHLPHQVELVIGQTDFFPYRVTYQKWEQKEKQLVLIPVVTTEFFEVGIGRALDPTQFQYEQPTHVHVADHTDVFLKSLGVANRPHEVKTR